jgi:hypothetical protein
VDKPRNGDEGAIALLKWALAALLFVNGAALVLALARHGVREALLEGSGYYYAGGLLCALLGAGCWAISYASTPREPADEAPQPASVGQAGSAQPGSNDPAVALGAMAIMLWVASLTTFVIGCEHVSWTPERKAVHQADKSVPAERRD